MPYTPGGGGFRFDAGGHQRGSFSRADDTVGIVHHEPALVDAARLEAEDAAREHVRRRIIDARRRVYDSLVLEPEEGQTLFPLGCSLLAVTYCYACGTVVVAGDEPFESGALERRGRDNESAGGDSVFRGRR
jgi:hypothetical protein